MNCPRKPPADVDADALIQQVHHRAAIARAAGATPARAAAMAAFTAYDAESVRIIAERKGESFGLYGVYEHLGLTRRAASDAVADLNRLLDKHPQLLAHEPRASAREWE